MPRGPDAFCSLIVDLRHPEKNATLLRNALQTIFVIQDAQCLSS